MAAMHIWYRGFTRLVAIVACGLAAIVLSESAFLSENTLGEKEAVDLLRGVDAELAWPGFKKDPSLLAYAFQAQASLGSPDGSLADKIQLVSRSPLVFVIDDFMSPQECAFLRSWGISRLKPAMVVQSSDNWYDTQAQTRNNEQLWLTQSEEKGVPLLRHLMKRIHRTVRIPDEYAEALQIGRYKTGTKYEGHIDSDPPHNVARPVTALTYLNDPEEGGDTLFPVGRDDCNAIWRTHPKTGEQVYGAAVCCETPENDAPETVRVPAKMGRIVLFFSHNPDGSINHNSQHIGCPVTKGEKWIAQRWLRYEPYNRVNYEAGAGFDPRFDGVPTDEMRAAERAVVHQRVLSQIRPKAYLEEHFLSDDEANLLMGTLAASWLKAGHFAHIETQEKREETTLTKEDLDKDEMLKNITARVHILARLPPIDSVQMTIKRFHRGSYEHARMHSDPPDEPNAISVNVYLMTVEEGGELFFPEAKKKDAKDCNQDIVACCAATSLKLRPRRGDAVLIYSHDQRGRLDRTSKHGHCPVPVENWVATWRFNFDTEIQGQPASAKQDKQPKCVFENQREETVFIFWVAPHGGDESPMGEVAPMGKKLLNSFSGHVFHVRDEAGELIEKYHVGNTPHQRFLVPANQEL